MAASWSLDLLEALNIHILPIVLKFCGSQVMRTLENLAGGDGDDFHAPLPVIIWIVGGSTLNWYAVKDHGDGSAVS